VAQFVSSEQDGAIAVITIDNPPMNALSSPLLEELYAEVDRVDADESVRAVVIHGAGERAFVAGADIKEFPVLREQGGDGTGAAGLIHKVADRMEAGRTPFIAAIQGFCLGGGLELAMGCDIRVAADNATVGQPEIKLGIIPGGGGTQRLPRLVGRGRAMLMNLTGDFFDARTAESWGLLDRVVPAEELLDAAKKIAATIASRSPHAAGVIKQIARETSDGPLADGARAELDGFLRCLRSEDGVEGVAAFIEKREPTFPGR
jgi:enoyl-CoA hydratase